MGRWRWPTLSIHGIEGAFSDAGAKTVLPRRVSGKFSIRLVPDMQPATTEKLVKDYLEAQWRDVVGSKYTPRPAPKSSVSDRPPPPGNIHVGSCGVAGTHLRGIYPRVTSRGALPGTRSTCR